MLEANVHITKMNNNENTILARVFMAFNRLQRAKNAIPIRVGLQNTSICISAVG